MAIMFFGPYHTVGDGKLSIIDRLVFRYILKTGLSGSELPMVTIYGSKCDSLDRVICYECVIRDSGSLTEISIADVIKMEDESLFSIFVKIENYEGFQELNGIDVSYKEYMDIPIRRKA